MNIYLKHTGDINVFHVSRSAAKNSKLLKSSILENPNAETYGSESNPMIVTVPDITTMPFIIRYLEFFADRNESAPPEAPLRNVDISVLLDGEYHLFADIYAENINLGEKLQLMKIYIEAAIYFDIKHLHKKLAAIVAFLIKNKTIAELKELMD